jgi:riboflavin synthase
MFTGIIECLGTVVALENEGSNLHIFVKSSITNELKIDQSLSHNGVCLTVVEINNDTYKVVAVAETLQKTNIGNLKVGDKVNLERAMVAGGRLDGHLVQGHVDATATIKNIQDKNGSWLFTIQYTPSKEHVVVAKGSVCIDGVSLTVVNPIDDTFSVAIIPYTYEHTRFNQYKIGDTVNIEFDIIGKYFARYFELYSRKG